MCRTVMMQCLQRFATTCPARGSSYSETQISDVPLNMALLKEQPVLSMPCFGHCSGSGVMFSSQPEAEVDLGLASASLDGQGAAQSMSAAQA
mmetsp:Transcript_142266/g.370628  ORF Transcript_142266/g.370628 Transcript_142266/m.370628 type:complete len:92 (-) Transcript_142266:88-363(-)